MSETNGFHTQGPPEGGIVLTLDLLEQSARRWVKLPSMSDRLAKLSKEDLLKEGWIKADATDEQIKAIQEQGVYVEICAVAASDAMASMPYIPGSETWSADRKEREAQWQTWRDGLTEEARRKYDQDLAQGQQELVATALLNPAVSAQQVRRFKDDVAFLVLQVMDLSGLTTAKKE